MTTIERDSILNEAIKRYGKFNQIEMMVEECSELIHAIQKYKRAINKGKGISECADNICGELSDVIILTMQMRKVFNNKRIEELIDFKLLREHKRLHP